MTNTIITIGREFGSGGCEIGHKLAEKLGIIKSSPCQAAYLSQNKRYTLYKA